MDVCPLCNGLETIRIQCPQCQSPMEDQGKITDYFDDYSPYLDIEIMKVTDGNPRSLEEHQCLHYFYCSRCKYEEIKGIQE
ncbi:MAG TPA: hypothetical protein VK057_09525 [Bacillota bacterium]|nr:hypothetical protein [Bacillota bacterium]